MGTSFVGSGNGSNTAIPSNANYFFITVFCGIIVRGWSWDWGWGFCVRVNAVIVGD